MSLLITVANQRHLKYASDICRMIADAAKIRGTGIAKRSPEYISKKMQEGKAVIATDGEVVAGFCYIENWEGQKYVANSGLIVHPAYRGIGLARKIKSATFALSKKKFPTAKLFGITTSLAVMKINSDLGYSPVTYSELTQDDIFWSGCQSCPNYDILKRTNRTMCLCTAMVCDLSALPEPPSENFKIKKWEKFRRFLDEKRKNIQLKIQSFPKQILKK